MTNQQIIASCAPHDKTAAFHRGFLAYSRPALRPSPFERMLKSDQRDYDLGYKAAKRIARESKHS